MVLSLEELQSSCGVSACTLIPQELPPAVKVNKQKLRRSTTNDNRAKKLNMKFSDRNTHLVNFVIKSFI